MTLQVTMNVLACADGSGNDLNLYSPLWMFKQEEGESLLDTIKRRMESILQRSKGLRNELQYYGMCWALAHVPTYRLALDKSKTISDVYKENVHPECIQDKDLPSVDTAIQYEEQLIEIFDRHSPATSPTSRLLGKGFKKSSSVRYEVSLTIYCMHMTSNYICRPLYYMHMTSNYTYHSL